MSNLRLDELAESENIYGGFWRRLASLFLDYIFILPLVIISLYINNLNKLNYLYTIIPLQVFNFWYFVHLTKIKGGTPGKLLCGLIVLKENGLKISYKESFLRYSVYFFISIFQNIIMITAILNADDNYYDSLKWLDKSKYIQSIFPALMTTAIWLSNIWVYSEFLVLLTNKKRKAIHDYMAGTVIVKKEYLNKIESLSNSL